jgi:hypothetical protein
MSAIAGSAWHGRTLPVVGKLNHVAESKANINFGVRKKGTDREGKERGVTHSREDRKVAHRVRWMRIHRQIQRTAMAKAVPSASCALFFALWTLRSQPR